MQSCKQEQPLALTAVKSHYPTNGKEEEVNTGEEAKCDEAAVLRSADRFGGKDREKMHTRNLSVSFWKDNF